MKSQRFQKLKDFLSNYIPEWYKKYWKDGGFRMMTYGIFGLFAFFTAGICFYEREFRWEGFLFAAFYFVIILPVSYLMRNSK